MVFAAVPCFMLAANLHAPFLYIFVIKLFLAGLKNMAVLFKQWPRNECRNALKAVAGMHAHMI
jgi:hypothetical protein